MTQRQRAIENADRSFETEAALIKLDKSHFSLDRVFIIARNEREESKILDTQLCKFLRSRFDARISNIAKDYCSLVEYTTAISL